MSVTIATRADITPESVRRVAWEGEDVALASAALEQMDRAHRSFTAFVDARIAEDPGALIYGTTTAPGDGAAVALTPEAQARRPTRLWTAHAFGAPLPDRVVRAIVLARLANFVDGHAAVRSAAAPARARRATPLAPLANFVDGHASVRSEVARAVAAMPAEPLPEVPSQGNGG